MLSTYYCEKSPEKHETRKCAESFACIYYSCLLKKAPLLSGRFLVMHHHQPPILRCLSGIPDCDENKNCDRCQGHIPIFKLQKVTQQGDGKMNTTGRTGCLLWPSWFRPRKAPFRVECPHEQRRHNGLKERERENYESFLFFFRWIYQSKTHFRAQNLAFRVRWKKKKKAVAFSLSQRQKQFFQ